MVAMGGTGPSEIWLATPGAPPCQMSCDRLVFSTFLTASGSDPGMCRQLPRAAFFSLYFILGSLYSVILISMSTAHNVT